MKQRVICLATTAFVALAWVDLRAAHADVPDASDPALARTLLKEGYELARTNQCDKAIPLLLRSAKLDPQPRAHLNLARCEETRLHFADAVRHWVLARDLAREQNLRAVLAETDARLALLEERMPVVTLKLDRQGLPEGTGTVRILRDNTPMSIEALDHPTPVDPGSHTIVVEADGREPRAFTFDIAERQHLEVALAPGPELPVTPTSSPPPLATPIARPQPVPLAAAPAPAGRTVGNALFYSGAGLAAVGLVTGTVTGILTLGKSSLRDACPNGQCPPDVMADVDRARTTGTISTVAFSAAAVGLAAAGVGMYLKLRAPPGRTPTEAIVVPTLQGIHAQVTF